MKTIFTSAILFFAFLSLAQDDNSIEESRVKKYFSVSLNVGSHALHNPISDATGRSYLPHYYNASLLYKVTPVFGLRSGAHFHTFKMQDAPSVKYSNLTIDVCFDLNQIGTYGFVEEKYETSVVAYLGVGLASMWRDRSATLMNDPYFKGNDDMFSVSLGLNPRMKIAKNMFINLDVSYVSQFFLSRSYDFLENYERRGFGGGFLRYSFGLTYEFR